MKLYRLLLYSFLLLFPLASYAYEPPSVPVEEAIKKGYASFIGRIIRIEEIENQEYWSIALADVEVIQTFYGLAAKKGHIVKVKFYSRLFTEIPNPGFDMSFSVSDVILFIFNNPTDKKAKVLDFNSYWVHPRHKDWKIDLAYRAYDDPRERYSPQREEHSFISAYGGSTRYDVRLEDLYEFGEARSAELDRTSEADILDFQFMDSSGRLFQTTHLFEQFEKIYDYLYPSMTVILIETPSVANPQFREQMRILDSLEHGEAEELQLIYVIASSNAENKDGYHTSVGTAKRLANNEELFRIRLLTANGEIYFTSNEPVESDELRAIVKSRPAYADDCVKTFYEAYVMKYISQVEEGNAAIFLSTMSSGNIRQILIIEVDSKNGLLIEKDDCSISNLASVAYSREKGTFVVQETHGGIYSYERIGKVLNELLNEQFILLQSHQLRALVFGRLE